MNASDFFVLKWIKTLWQGDKHGENSDPLTCEADLPARSGLGTSGSFAVGMLNAFYALKGKYADKRKLADQAICLECVLCHEADGG